MPPYAIDRTSNHRRQEVEAWLFGLDQVSAKLRDDIVTAWVSAWSSSPYAALADMPFGPGVDYPLMHHVNEVTRAWPGAPPRIGTCSSIPRCWCRS